MGYFVYGIVILFFIVVLLLYIISGEFSYFGRMQDVTDENSEIERDDAIERLKKSLEDLDIDKEMGKIDNADFEILRKEYVSKWKILEKSKGN